MALSFSLLASRSLRFALKPRHSSRRKRRGLVIYTRHQILILGFRGSAKHLGKVCESLDTLRDRTSSLSTDMQKDMLIDLRLWLLSWSISMLTLLSRRVEGRSTR